MITTSAAVDMYIANGQGLGEFTLLTRAQACMHVAIIHCCSILYMQEHAPIKAIATYMY